MLNIPKSPKKAIDKNKIVVVHPSIGCIVKKIITEYKIINIDIHIINTAIETENLYPIPVNKIKESTASSNRNFFLFYR